MPQSPYIVWFAHIEHDDAPLVGAKGASLGTLTALGLPVPNGFCLTSTAYTEFLDATGLREKLHHLLAKLPVDQPRKVAERAAEAQALIRKAELPESIAHDLVKAYHQFSPKDVFVAVRSSLVETDVPEEALVGSSATFLNVLGAGWLLEAVKETWASLFEPAALVARAEHQVDHFQLRMAVAIQRMVEAEVSGIAFSADPLTRQSNRVVIEAVWGLGEALASGVLTPDHYEVDKADWNIVSRQIVRQGWQLARTTHKQAKSLHDANMKLAVSVGWQARQKLADKFIVETAQLTAKVERHLGKPQQCEWVYADKAIYLVQTETAVQLPLLSTPAAAEVSLVSSDASHPGHPPVLVGLAASTGMAHGLAYVARTPADAKKIKSGSVLVVPEATADYADGLRKAVAVVADAGGQSSDGVRLAQELGIPAVVGTGDGSFMLKNGESLTVDGSAGKVYDGQVRLTPANATVTSANASATQSYPMPATNDSTPVVIPLRTATKLYVTLNDPELAEETAGKGCDGVGLLRLENLVKQVDEHPRALIDLGKAEALTDKLYDALMTVTKSFDPRPVVYRLSDLNSGQYRRLHYGEKYEEAEDNPLLGYHGGARFVGDAAVLKVELAAIRKTRQYHKNIWLVLPWMRTPDELIQLKQLLAEEGLYRGGSFKLLMEIDVPANVALLDQFIGVGIDGVVINPSDMAQLMLGIDRANPNVAALLDERNEAVMWALEQVTRGAAKHGLLCSVVGQAPSAYPELTRKIIEWGASSVSVSPEALSATRQMVAEAEYDVVRAGRKK